MQYAALQKINLIDVCDVSYLFYLWLKINKR